MTIRSEPGRRCDTRVAAAGVLTRHAAVGYSVVGSPLIPRLGGEDACAEEVKLGAAVVLALEQLHAMDMALNGAG